MTSRATRVVIAAVLLLTMAAPGVQARVIHDDDPPPPDSCDPGEYSKTGIEPCQALADPQVFPPAGTTGADFGCWTVVVPNGKEAVQILAVGAAGESTTNAAGGLGDSVSATAFGILDDDRLRICVNSNAGPGGTGSDGAHSGGDGGGASGVALGSTFRFPFVIAGGGGGAAYNHAGGSAGMPQAQDGFSNPSGAAEGAGANNNSGSAAPGGQGFVSGGSGTDGASFTAGGPAVGGTGGNGTTGGGGGGAGYRSGGGGGGDTSIVNVAAGGGGGTSFCGDTHVSGEIVVSGCTRTGNAGTKTTWGSGDGFAKVTLAFLDAAMCAAGTYSTTGFETPTPCTPAAAGHFVDAAGATAQSECALGFYQPLTGKTSCLAADIGFYVDSTGATGQTACPSGQTTAATGSDSLDDCFAATVDDTTPPTMGAVSAYLREGGRVGSASITVDWDANDDVSATEDLTYEVQRRVRKRGAWSAWKKPTIVSDASLLHTIPLWRTAQYRVRARDESGNWSEWRTSNTIKPIRRSDNAFAYEGAWQKLSIPGAIRRTVHQAESTGYPTAALRFKGTGVAVVMSGSDVIVNFFLDANQAGAQVEQKRFTATAGERRFVAVFTGLANGLHTIQVQLVAGTSNLDGAIVTH